MMSFLENYIEVTENGNVKETGVHAQAQSHKDQSHETEQTIHVREENYLPEVHVDQKFFVITQNDYSEVSTDND
jgi:hypothetical protein